MESITTSLVFWALLTPAFFYVAGLLAAFSPKLSPKIMGFLIRQTSYINLLFSVAASVLVATKGFLFSPTLGNPSWGFSLRLDPLSVLIWLMISLLAVVILRYSVRYLEGDKRHASFLGRMAITFASVQILVLSGNLGIFLLAWIATSISLHRLLLFYSERRAARLAAWKKFATARMGDLCIFAAAANLSHHFGTGDLETIFQAFHQGGSQVESFGFLGITGVLFAMAAILKSAQFPLHGWLVEVMETPTPVSALLHAGVLNAGPFLVVRMSPIMHEATAASALLVIVGGFTGWFASTALLPQPSVKVALGYSSAAHMGFMLMVAGLGVYPAVVLHLVAHSFYKAHAFLSSGSVVEAARNKSIPLPSRLGSLRRIAGSLGIALLVYTLFAIIWGVHPLQRPSLLAVGIILVLGMGQIIAPALDSKGPRKATLLACGMAIGVAIAFFSLEAGAHALLHSVLPELTTPALPILFLAAATVLLYQLAVIMQMYLPVMIRTPTLHAWAIHLRNGLYVNAALDRLAGSLHISKRQS